MALNDPVVLIALAAAVALVVYLVQLNLKATRAQAAPTDAAQPGEQTEEDPLAKLLVRFVEDPQGNPVGETVSAEGDLIIIKQGSTYKAVPAKHLEDTGDNLVVKGVVDWSRSEQLGKEWLERTTKPNPNPPEGQRDDDEERQD